MGSEKKAQIRPWGRSERAALALSVATWVCLLPRLVAGSYGDHGTFVSVADRLRAGDSLYAEVWDNKDPLFYYVLALGRSVTPVASAVLEVTWLALACLAATSIAAGVPLAHWRRLLVGWVATPLVLTGTAYEPGMTQLPGTAVALGALAFALRKRWVGAGVLLGLVALLKITTTPVVVVMLIVMVAAGRAWRGGALAAASAGLTTVLGCTVMAFRGEFGPYVSMLVANVGYTGQIVDSRWGSFIGHWLRVAPESGNTPLITLAGIVATVIVTALGRPTTVSPAPGALRWSVIGGLGAAIVVIGITGQWPHHGQLLYVLAVPCVILLAASVEGPPGLQGRSLDVAYVVVAAVVLGGVVHPYSYARAIRDAQANVASLTGPSPEALSLASHATSGTYARLGTNDVSAHARGTAGWELGCPRFHQYPFESEKTLMSTVDCLSRVDAVLVHSSFAPQAGQDRWNSFVASARNVLNEHFDCAPASFGEFCVVELNVRP